MVAASNRSSAVVESPVLKLDSFGYEWIAASTDTLDAWVCNEALQNLFAIAGAKKISLIAKPKPDRHTYKVEIIFGHSHWLIKPEKHVLWPSLSSWLMDQIATGRPHIGVMIIE